MNQYVQQLYKIANQESRLIIGLMSGTSLDGLDVALCRITGSGPSSHAELIHFTTVSYDLAFRDKIRTVFARKEIEFEYLTVLNSYIGVVHGQMVLRCLNEWGIAPSDVDVIASHGQTVYHAPKKQHQREEFANATLQIGDGDHLAVTTGIITLSDFRQKHIAAGGEGAPLAVYGDYLLFAHKGEDRILLNMGGIANFTYLPGNLDANSVFTTDTGPGNTLLDAYTNYFFARPYDQDGKIAASGRVNKTLLAALKNYRFFSAAFPKTTGPEVFNPDYVTKAQEAAGVGVIAPQDLIATLTQLSGDTICEAIKRTIQSGQRLVMYASGGGAHNPVLMGHIRRQLPDVEVKPMGDLGISGDAKEAVLFAVLANETLAGGTTDFGLREGVPSVTMGKISFPG
jgi:anhydro-N-acetylmuramic acid kinase